MPAPCAAPAAGPHRGQALGEDAAWAFGRRAAEAAELKIALADPALPRQITKATDVAAVNTTRTALTQGTCSRRGTGADGNNDAIRGNNNPLDDEAGREQ